LVLDPVLISGSGDEYASEEMVAALRELLLPQTTVVTPDSLQARRLAQDGEDESDYGDLAACARAIVATGAEYVLLTGAREQTAKVINTLYGEHGPIRADAWERLPGAYRGAGGTLASAVAANLANGLDVVEAVRDAQDYTWQALAAAFRPGMGRFVPDRFFWARGEEDGG
jgi:hydroxymethylpyrimidine/phosphomethylpyrimidine kinase